MVAKGMYLYQLLCATNEAVVVTLDVSAETNRRVSYLKTLDVIVSQDSDYSQWVLSAFCSCSH